MSDFYEITVPAVTDPILFAKASAWCRDIDISDTELVNELISAATILVEKQTNRVLEVRTIKGNFDRLCTSIYENKEFVEIKRSPLISIISATVNGDILTSSQFILKKSSSYARILFNDSHILDEDLAYAIEIVFTVGYASVPKDLITALEQIVLFWYENRGDVSANDNANLPTIARRIIKNNRIVNTFG